MHDRIILGIDPGTNLLGYGLLALTAGKQPEMLAMGVIDLRKCDDPYLRLGRIFQRVMSIIDEFHPDELAIEAPFFGKNVQSMLKLGRAEGVVIAAAISRQIPVHEYAPMEIKQAITSRGSASKEQVAEMMRRLLHLTPQQLMPYLDATDALAVAYCHHLGTARPTPAPRRSARGSSWAAYVKQNPGKVSKL